MKIKEYFQSLVKAGTIQQEPMNYDATTLKIYIDHLESENATLRERLEKSVELPFLQKDGEVIVLIYKDKEGVVFTEKYFTDEYYGEKKGEEAAKSRLAELKGENKDDV